MREKIDGVLKSIFSIFVLIALLGGGVVFGMFMIALVVGGETGTNLATSAQKTMMPYFIKSATIAVFAGLLSFYNTKTHALSLDDKDEDEVAIADVVSAD